MTGTHNKVRASGGAEAVVTCKADSSMEMDVSDFGTAQLTDALPQMPKTSISRLARAVVKASELQDAKGRKGGLKSMGSPDSVP